MRKIPRRLTSVVAVAVALALVGATPSAYAETGRWPDAGTTTKQPKQPTRVAKPKVAYDQLALPDGRKAKVYSNGMAIITAGASGRTEYRQTASL